MLWKKFNALGSEIVVTTNLTAEQISILDQVESATRLFEQKFSRFDQTSELNQFNGALEEFVASDLLIELIELAKTFNQQTKGIFDPTIIESLEKVGYDQSFTAIKPADDAAQNPPDLAVIKAAFLNRKKITDLEIIGHRLYKPAGFRLDLGGLGKGFVSDWLARTVLDGVSDYWLSAGGDLLVKGNDQDKVGWLIGIQNPSEPDKQIYAIQTTGETLGIATSGVFKRQGSIGDFHWHHLIDPRTGLPVENNILAVTAITTSAVKADVYAKTVLILGEAAGLEFIEAQADSACIIFYKSGGIKFSSQAIKYIRTYETGI